MDKYNLQFNESVIMKSESARHGKTNGELVLTNLSLIHVAKKGLLKREHVTQRFPLDQIKLFDGKAQVMAGKSGVLDIYFVNGHQSFTFSNNDTFFSEKKAEKEAEQWAARINQLRAGEQVAVGNVAHNEIEYVAETLKGTLHTIKGVFGKTTEPEQTAKACTSCGSSVSGLKGSVVRCAYCEAKQQL